MRDVERAGEGLVSATFGAVPDRVADWSRAAQVEVILKTVWSKSKAATPDLPVVQVGAVDHAIVALDAAIASQSQRDAAYASNAVGLAVPELFQHFNPDAPIEIVRLDVVFRQVGLDAHFGDWSSASADLATMTTDYGASKQAISARVPTCHRVGGTATVIGEIEARSRSSARRFRAPTC